MLFIDNGQAKIIVGNALGYQRMRSDHDLGAAVGKRVQHRLAGGAAPLSKQQMCLDPQRCQKGIDAGMMLAGQNFGRGKERRL